MIKLPVLVKISEENIELGKACLYRSRSHFTRVPTLEAFSVIENNLVLKYTLTEMQFRDICLLYLILLDFHFSDMVFFNLYWKVILFAILCCPGSEHWNFCNCIHHIG